MGWIISTRPSTPRYREPFSLLPYKAGTGHAAGRQGILFLFLFTIIAPSPYLHYPHLTPRHHVTNHLSPITYHLSPITCPFNASLHHQCCLSRRHGHAESAPLNLLLSASNESNQARESGPKDQSPFKITACQSLSPAPAGLLSRPLLSHDSCMSDLSQRTPLEFFKTYALVVVGQVMSPLSRFETPLLRVSRPVSACQRCRGAKIRCDGKLPACTACERAGRRAECSSASDLFAKGKERSYVASLETRVEKLEKQLVQAKARKDSLVASNARPWPSPESRVAPRIGSSGAQRREASNVDDLVADFGFL